MGQIQIDDELALVACMRKLLVILNTMAKTNEPWRYVSVSGGGEVRQLLTLLGLSPAPA